MLFSPVWWKYAGIRALRTGLVLAIPTWPSGVIVSQADPLTTLLVFALGAVSSLITSLGGIPEVGGVNLSKGRALLIRVVKSFFQGAAVGLVGATLLTDVDWIATLELGIAGAVGAFLLGSLAALPETPEVVTPLPADGVPADAGLVGVVPEDTPVFEAPVEPEDDGA